MIALIHRKRAEAPRYVGVQSYTLAVKVPSAHKKAGVSQGGRARCWIFFAAYLGGVGDAFHRLGSHHALDVEKGLNHAFDLG